MSEGPGTRPMVIVGGGKAGGTAAATLRDEGFNGPVVLVSREPGIPFGRPPLSKTYLRSEEDLTDWYVRPPDWYEANDVDLRADSVVAVDPAAHALACMISPAPEATRPSLMLLFNPDPHPADFALAPGSWKIAIVMDG